MVESHSDELVRELSMHPNASNRGSGPEPSAERGKEIIFDAFGRNPDQHHAVAHALRDVGMVHKSGQTRLKKRCRTAAVVEQDLIAAAIDSDVGRAIAL